MMTTLFKKIFVIATVAVGVVAASSTAHAQTAFAIANGGATLISFNLATPSIVNTIGNFNGGASFLDGMDFRPLNGTLYGYLDATNTLYTVNTTTAALTAVATGVGAGATNTFQLGIDFNPMIDRLRVVTDSGQNLVYDPNSNASPTVATSLSYAVGSANENVSPLVLANAYSNNLAGTGSTTQYVIDYGTDQLATLANNTGVLTTVGNLGFNTGKFNDLDIFTSFGGVNSAYALLDTSGEAGSAPGLYSVNLTTGAATSVGAIGGGFTQVYGLAIVPTVVPEAGALPLLIGGMMTAGLGIVVRRRIKK